MTQDCSHSSSTANVIPYKNKQLPKGIHIVEADNSSASKKKDVPESEADEAPWGYLSLHHFIARNFDKQLQTSHLEGGFVPRCFIHRTVTYKHKANGNGIVKEEKPTVSGLVFLQGETKKLQIFLQTNFPQYHLVNNCATGKPASIPNSIMKPFMTVMKTEPENITFLHDPFIKFAHDHVRLRVLTGLFAGQEGYIVRIMRNRRLVMDLGGYAVAISNVHNEDFEIAE